MVYRMAPFSMTLNDPGFKVTPFFDAEYLRNGTRYKHSFNGILIGTYTRPTLRRCVQIRLLTYLLTYSTVSFRMTLNDLAKYSMTRASRGLSATLELLVMVWKVFDVHFRLSTSSVSISDQFITRTV